MNESARWTLDHFGCLNLLLRDQYGGRVHCWIAARQHYCDRGHWEFKVDAPNLYIDPADSFPRFFMDLETAIREAEAWIRWRLYRQTATPVFHHLIADQQGRAAEVAAPPGWAHNPADPVAASSSGETVD